MVTKREVYEVVELKRKAGRVRNEQIVFNFFITTNINNLTL